MSKDALVKDLMERVRRGDKSSFRELYQKFHAQLYLFARTLVSKEEAEDITANAFANLWHSRENIDAIQNTRAYLFRSVKNNCLNFLKHQKVVQANEKDIAYILDHETEINSKLCETEATVYESVLKEVEKLPNQCRTIFKLAFFDNLKNAEIAHNLNLEEQTVRNQKAKALKLLRLVFAKNPLLILFIAFLEHIDQTNL